MSQLSRNVIIGEVRAPIAAASNTDANTDILDMSGWDGVVFIVPVTDSVATGVATVTAEGNSANSDTGMTALTGAAATATSAADDDLNNQLLIVDVYKPLLRYIQAAITSATANIAFGTGIAIRYRGAKAPIANDSTVLNIARAVGV